MSGKGNRVAIIWIMARISNRATQLGTIVVALGFGRVGQKFVNFGGRPFPFLCANMFATQVDHGRGDK